REEDKYLRSQGAAALGKIGPEAGAAVPMLTCALRDKDEDVRREGAPPPGGKGPETQAAVPDPREVLKDGRKTVRPKGRPALWGTDRGPGAGHLGFGARLRRWLGEGAVP